MLPRALRRCLILGAAVAAPLATAAPALACSKDDTAYFDGFLDATCLQAPLTSTTIDTFGGLRLITNGVPVTTAWDTDTEFAGGVTHQATTFGRVGVSTLSTTGSGAPAALALPLTGLPLTPAPAGPVLSPSAATALDSDGVDDPAVVRVGSGYVMWYSGTAEDGRGPAILRATSPDGRSWTRANGGSPVLTGTAGAFDERGVSGPDVSYDPAGGAAAFRMYYAGQGDVFGAIGLATSVDGITWIKHDDAATAAAADPVLDHGGAGSPDSFSAADPSVLRDGATYKLWYTGDDSSKKRIAYATSPDGIAWTKGGKVISPEDPGANANYDFGAFAPTVFKPSGGGYRMLLTGRKVVGGSAFQTKIMDATSTDGITWTAPSPALNPSGNDAKFDFSNLNAPFVLADPADGSAPFKLWYAGNTVDANGNFHTRIGYATSNNGSSFGKVQNGAGVNADGSVLDIGLLSTSFDARQASGLSVAVPGGATPKFAGFYWGTRGSDFKPRLGHATSADGSTWTKVSASAPNGGALFALGGNNTFDNGGHRDPGALYDAGTYDLWFTAIDGDGERTIGFASAPEDTGTKQPDHTAWSARSQVLDLGTAGTFDDGGVSHPSVVKDGPGSYFMYYTADAGGATTIGRATAAAPGGPYVSRTQVLTAGAAATFDAGGVKDPVVVKVAAGDYRMLYTGVETAADGTTVERVGYATSSDGLTWAKQGVVLNPSQRAFGYDETGVEPTGMLVDGATVHVWTSGIDRTGRTRGGHATTAEPPAAGSVPSGWATYQLGGPATTVRDFRSITRTSSGSGVTLWMSFLQPYSSAGNEFWSDFFPVTVSDPAEVLNFLLTVRGVRWQARLSGPSGAPALDKVAIAHAPVSFAPSGSATTTDITPPAGQAISAWGDLTVSTALMSPGGGGSGGATLTVLDAGSGEQLATRALSTSGDTTVSLSGIDPKAHGTLRARLDLTSSDGNATPLVRSLKVLYNAAATPPAPPPPPPPAPALTLATTTPVITFGQQAVLTGTLTRAGAPLGSQTVSLLQQPAGAAAFASLTTAATDGAGAFRASVTPTATTTYAAAFSGVSPNPTVTVAVRHRVTLKAVRRGTKAVFTGRLGPVEAGRPVQILQRTPSGWKPFTTAKTGSTSAFSVSKTIKACARHTFKAVVAGDAQHQAGESAAMRVEDHRVALKVTVRSRRATLTGSVAPRHAGKVVVVQRRSGTRFVTFAKLKLAKKSTFKVVKKLKRGTYAFRASMRGDRCHFPGLSRVRTVRVR